MNWIDLLVSIATSKVLWFIIILVAFVFGYIKFKVWRFEKKYGCSDTEKFLFMVSNGENGEDKCGIWYSDIFNLETVIYLSNIFKRQSAAFVLPFKINLPVFKGKPRLELDQNVRCVVEKINEFHLAYKCVGDFYFWSDSSSKFIKHHDATMDYLCLWDSFIERSSLKKGDEFKFTFNKEGELTIQKFQKV